VTVLGRHRLPFVLGVLLLCCGPAAAQQTGYAALPEAKALAVAPGRPDVVRAISQGQPHDLAASVGAREQCQALAAPGEVCEVVRLNDTQITTGAEILRRVPDAKHPLFLWRFQRSGTVVYLAGSIHILKPSLYPLPEQLEAAFETSDYLVLEVDVTAVDPNDMQRRTLEYALLPGPQSLRDVLPGELYGRLDRHLAQYGMTADMLGRAKPAMVMNQLVISKLLTLGYLPESGLESHFLSRRGSHEILQLESLDSQLELLFNQPMATQVQLLAETLDVANDIEPLLTGMLVAWLSGDDARFLELFKAQSGDSPLSRAFTRALLEDRNHTMAAEIRRYLEERADQPRTYFVLVGAAHLVGDEGIVPLLEQQGFHGQRLSSKDSINERVSAKLDAVEAP
jgi:uncharacterized protein YbaP (TraB family)